MYTNARFQSIGTTSDFGTKFAENYMNNKTSEKTKIKIVISIQQSILVPNFSQLEELQILGPNLL